MIPKIIHLCWLSGDSYPDSIKKCINSWHQYLPDYEIWLWDTKRFDVNSSKWTKEAFETKKYAFAADYIRLYALYHYGGIYLDSDVIVYKSFDDLLDLPYFIGEDYVHCFEPAIIGAEKGCHWIYEVLKRYTGLSFINKDDTYNMRGLPYVFHDRLATKYKFRPINTKDEFLNIEDNTINIFSKDYFNSRDFVGIKKYKNSYCSHNYIGSWYKKEGNFKDYIKLLVPRIISNIYYGLMYQYKYKKQIQKIQIPYI